MRTTIELPADLFRAAKSRSAERGESLKALLTRALAAELQVSPQPGSGRRVRLPLFGSPAGPSVRVSNEDLERALADADVTGARTRRRPRPQGRKRR